MNDKEASAPLNDIMFVRGKSQLAPYSSERKPTGHRLTAFEAKDAYGEAVLREAIEFGSAVLLKQPGAAAKTLKEQREALGVDSNEMSKMVQLPVDRIEGDDDTIRIQDIQKLGLKLGLDERLLSFDLEAGADRQLGVRLRTLQAESQHQFSSRTVLSFAEAASLVRIQNRLSRWLDLPITWDQHDKSDDYGSPQTPAFQVGYELAIKARDRLGIGTAPINSMRDLVEDKLGIPVLQQSLPSQIAGATISNGADRGIILNIVGKNSSVFVRRSTLAHELGHLLFDPAQVMRNVTVDLYDENDLDPETHSAGNFVEQRANAFAITFLAPPSAVRDLVEPPITVDGVTSVMQTFGISATAARYHVRNSHYRQYDLPNDQPHVDPEDKWLTAEDFALDYFQPKEVPENRRGRFAGLVATCYQRGLISSDTAALYLECSADAFEKNVELILDLHPIEK